MTSMKINMVIADANVPIGAVTVVVTDLYDGEPLGIHMDTYAGRQAFILTDEDALSEDIIEAVRCLDDHLDNVVVDEHDMVEQMCANPLHTECYNRLPDCTHVDMLGGAYSVGDIILLYHTVVLTEA